MSVMISRESNHSALIGSYRRLSAIFGSAESAISVTEWDQAGPLDLCLRCTQPVALLYLLHVVLLARAVDRDGLAA